MSGNTDTRQSPGLDYASETSEPRRFKVLLHNDDYTTMDFVIHVLQQVFNKPEVEAMRIMLAVVSMLRTSFCAVPAFIRVEPRRISGPVSTTIPDGKPWIGGSDDTTSADLNGDGRADLLLFSNGAQPAQLLMLAGQTNGAFAITYATSLCTFSAFGTFQAPVLRDRPDLFRIRLERNLGIQMRGEGLERRVIEKIHRFLGSILRLKRKRGGGEKKWESFV